MRVFYCDHYQVELPAGHRFPMGRYAELRRRLVSEGVLEERELHPSPPAELPDLLRAHDAGYVRAFLDGRLPRKAIQRIGFPWSPALVKRSLASTGGTLAASLVALEEGISGHLAGGTHHAQRGFGAGYCVFNDLAVAALHCLAAGRVERVLIFDLDVHQGDGTAAIFADDARVFTCSLHGARNFPARKQRSDLDVEFPDGTGDGAYLEAMQSALEHSLERARPDLVLYQAGVDTLAEDRLGRLNLSHAGLRERDERALGRFSAAGLPVVITLGGGYGKPIEATLRANLDTWRAARGFRASRRQVSGLE